MKVALVYDRVNKWGGAERVLLALHDLFPDAPLYTSVYDKENAPWANVFKIKTSFLQNLPFASKRHEFLAPLMPFAFESFDFSEYDLVISLTSEAAKGILTAPGTLHICYCLTPTRYLWSGYEEYFKNTHLSVLSRPVVNSLRKWDLVASQRPDAFIAISKEVQKRIKKYYERDSELVYPPITIKDQGSKIKSQGKYFLVVSRLSKFTRYKRVDLAIDACSELGLPLKIVGDGNLRKELEKRAGPTIEFTGNLNDEELADYYRGSKALIFPGYEDLGLVMVEAQRFGKPVIAYKAGGAVEIIIEGKTGIFFNEQSKKSLKEALQAFEGKSIDSKACIKNSEKFDLQNFNQNFLSVVNNLLRYYNK